jgi:hypothetical protein
MHLNWGNSLHTRSLVLNVGAIASSCQGGHGGTRTRTFRSSREAETSKYIEGLGQTK